MAENKRINIMGAESMYEESYKLSLENKEAFWKEQAEAIEWFKKPQQILTKENGRHRWFSDGVLNTCYLALDYHIEQGRGDQTALVYDSPVSSTKETFSYRQLRNRVAKFAGALHQRDVQKGDTVIIYMPMITEAVIAMLACARIGAIHSVVFGGFAPHELALRIDDAKPKAIITASCGIEFTTIIPYKPLVDEALQESVHQPAFTVIAERPEQAVDLDEENELDFHALMSEDNAIDPVPLKSTDPLYILYTSGTTGTPKGIVRDNGGHAVALKYSMETVYDAQPGDVYWAASDVGWVVGHSYIVYAPLIQGCTTILYEGKPVQTPDAGAFWRMIQEYKISSLFTAPTAIRAIKKEDFEGEFIEKYDISSLKMLFLAGERCDPPTYEWAREKLKVPVIDHWWQTETGWPIVANPMGMEPMLVKPGSATKPVPGYDVRILDKSGNEVPAGEEGFITIKLPLPPGCLPTLWKNQERYEKAYLSKFDGYYNSGDGGYKDKDGYVFIMGRVDDVINVSGHRLSTGEMEEVIAAHPAIAECAVIGINDELKGEVPLGILVLKNETGADASDIEADLIARVRKQIGAVASFKKVVIVKRLPKTRSGKILRKTMRQIINRNFDKMPSTINDPSILDEIKETFKENGLLNILS